MFEALQAAVNIAKSEQIHSLDRLKGRLQQEGFAEADIEEAIQTWANYAAQNR